MVREQIFINRKCKFSSLIFIRICLSAKFSVCNSRLDPIASMHARLSKGLLTSFIIHSLFKFHARFLKYVILFIMAFVEEKYLIQSRGRIALNKTETPT